MSTTVAITEVEALDDSFTAFTFTECLLVDWLGSELIPEVTTLVFHELSVSSKNKSDWSEVVQVILLSESFGSIAPFASISAWIVVSSETFNEVWSAVKLEATIFDPLRISLYLKPKFLQSWNACIIWVTVYVCPSSVTWYVLGSYGNQQYPLPPDGSVANEGFQSAVFEVGENW